MGKGSYFSIRNPANRAKNAAEEINEEPILLDPVTPADTRLLCLDESSGAPRPRFQQDDDDWRHRRAAESIDYYHLNEGTWNAERADLMAAVRKLCDQLDEILATRPRDETAYGQKLDEIVAYISPFAEFSSACLQVVRENGFLEHLASGL